ncbi:queuine tRNA-ribosyltransferase accessory subunit 2 isoform X2 [Bacillus rossius redtenbacheri]|uniref:queuine tRNA-ribosyltransferase accessory subunit 2 isoform X2 n=1 Tax=Bacillus rossius redtenbacheri TaxID=93214 RepID=UPI002FDCAFE2
MKFTVQYISGKCLARLGCITEIERLPGEIFETPLLFLHSKGGSLPHLTYEVVKLLTKETLCLQVPLSSTLHFQRAVKEFSKGIAEFAGLKEFLMYCTVQDSAVATPAGYNEKDFVSVWARSGKTQISAERYMDVMEAFKPDMYQALCDGDTNENSSKKRVTKALSRSSLLFDECFRRHCNSEVLKGRALLGVVQGGYNLHLREGSARELAQRDVAGFVIDGLHNNGPDAEALPYDKVRPVVRETIKHLPGSKFRIVHGCWSPGVVLGLVQEGVDAFDGSYPFLVTERGSALTFKHRARPSPVCPAETGGRERVEKEENTNSSPTQLKSPQRKGAVDTKYEIPLKEERFADDFRPICSDCSCLTCRKHTRAYICHLLNVNELLGPVLLMIHNTHHYLEFFKSIRTAIRSDSLQELQVMVQQHSR